MKGLRHSELARESAAVAVCVALAATAFDALLLQLRRSYFFGGFLSRDHVESVGEAAAFAAGSLLADFAVAGTLAVAAIWAVRRVPMRPRTRLVVAGLLALSPFVLANVIEYQLVTYLGDAFDLRLLFELTGRDPAEFLAVSSAHLARWGWVAGAGLIACGAGVWWALRRRPTPDTVAPVAASRARPVFAMALTLFVVGAVGVALLRSGSDVLDNGLRRKPSGRLLGAFIAAATDVDGDGSGVLGRPSDPDLLDSHVRPYGLDVPGNGVDEDGVAGDLPLDSPPYVEKARAASGRQSSPDVVLVVLESFRADVVGASIDRQPVTPVLNGLASKGIAARYAYSHNGYTAQSRWHIFSGSTAGVRGDTTLIDDFKARGYRTAYFSAQDDSYGGRAYSSGFERADVAYDARTDRNRRYSTFTTAGSLAVPYNVLEERVGTFLESRDDARPLFLYVNFHDTHFPYHHARIQPLVSRTVLQQQDIGPATAASLRAMYLNTAANVDRAIGRVLERVRQARGREPGVVVLADHGESLFDEGFLGHGYALNDAQTRIPLIAANLPIVLVEPFGQSDLRDALLDALGRPPTADAPQLKQDGSRIVFQYLGQIQSPAQIAFVGLTGRIVYDFRERLVRTDDASGWQRPQDLEGAARSTFLDLIHTWERMMLARNAHHAGGRT